MMKLAEHSKGMSHLRAHTVYPRVKHSSVTLIKGVVWKKTQTVHACTWMVPDHVRYKKIYLEGATWKCASSSGMSHNSNAKDVNPEGASGIIPTAHAIYQFSRPHTMAGTTISILSISFLALQGSSITVSIMMGLIQALASALLMNISIVGTNQLFDIEIDKINKPYLPLASGAFSITTGFLIVSTCTALSFLIGWASGSVPLIATLTISFLLGLAYSADLPLMRWKRSPMLAATCILAIRAIAVQLGFYWHMKHVMGGAGAISSASLTGMLTSMSSLPAPIIFTVSFMLFFSVVIALFKDIPDAQGDLKAGLMTLTVRMGNAVPFWTCIWLLTICYIGACGYSVVMASLWGPAAGHTVAAALSSSGFSSATVVPTSFAAPASLSMVAALPVKTLVSILGHAVLGTLLWTKALKVDLSRKEDITDCYMHIWKLFYAEYILIPFFA